MLKVMKYDWRNGWNNVKLTLIADAVFSILLGVILGFVGDRFSVSTTEFGVFGDSISPEWIPILVSIIWFSVMTALLVLTVNSIAQNLSGRMFGLEGYLTHTLPVHTWQLLAGKALGTWLFGVFMVIVAAGSLFLVVASTAASTLKLGEFIHALITLLPKLGSYHLHQIATGLGYLCYGIAAFLAFSLVMIVQLQFICIAARQFGKHHFACGIILSLVLSMVENRLDDMTRLGFLIPLFTAALCFYGSQWLLQKKLHIA